MAEIIKNEKSTKNRKKGKNVNFENCLHYFSSWSNDVCLNSKFQAATQKIHEIKGGTGQIAYSIPRLSADIVARPPLLTP